MILEKPREIIQQTQNYLRHQRELYGDILYFNRPHILRDNPSSKKRDMLEAYLHTVRNCSQCGLSKSRIHFVFGTGNPDANLMLIGEAPGEEEDRQGEPFVGKAGQLLDKILAAIDFRRDEVYIGNILKCRPPGNRDPLPEEIDRCKPLLFKQLDIIKPKMIMALGRVAAQSLLQVTDPLGRLRGVIQDFRGIPLIATYHPAALLRNPQWKRATWEDVQKLRRLYDEIVQDKPKWQPNKK